MIEEIKTHESEWLDILSKCEIKYTDNIKPPPPVVQVDIKENEHVTIMTKGNISVVKGQAKSRKSFLLTLLMGSIIKLVRKDTFTSPHRMKCVYFDTEQSAFYVKQITNRVAHIAGVEMLDNAKFYSLRHMSATQRKEAIKIAFSEFKNFDIFILDGVRDIMKDINSQEESTEVVNDLMKWTGESGIHLIAVLHENPSTDGGGKARGHIGTELMNKAETVLEVIKDKDNKEYSCIKPYMVRGIDFEPIYFTVVNGIPVIDENYSSEIKNINNKKDAAVPF